MNRIDEASDLLKRRMNTLKLSVSVLGQVVDRDPQRALSWTHGIDMAADRLAEAVEQLNAVTLKPEDVDTSHSVGNFAG